MAGIMDILGCYPIYQLIKRYCNHCDLVNLHKANVIKLSEKDIRILKENLSPEIVLFKNPENKGFVRYWKPVIDGIKDGKLKLWSKDLIYFLNVYDLPDTIQLNITITKECELKQNDIVTHLLRLGYSKVSVYIQKWRQSYLRTLSRKITDSSTVILYIWKELDITYPNTDTKTISTSNYSTLYLDSKIGIGQWNIIYAQYQNTRYETDLRIFTINNIDNRLCSFINRINTTKVLEDHFFTEHLNHKIPKYLYDKYIPYIRNRQLFL